MRTVDIKSNLLATVRSDTDDNLKRFFDRKIAEAESIDPAYKELWVVLAELSRAGGKRLRPYMSVLAYRAFGGKDDAAIMPVATAQELLHLSMLVHDDIIDRDLVRYGVKNVQGYYEKRYAKYMEDKKERTHYAASAAIMAGDVLLSAAYEITLTANLSVSELRSVQKYLSSAVFSVVGGELLDTEAPLLPVHAVNTRHVALYKTASYSFNGPLMTGASLAGADEATLDKLKEFGEALGVAYQLTDDLLGVFGDDTLTGKSTSSDISEGKRTMLLQETYRLCSETDRKILEGTVGNGTADENETETVRSIMRTSGAKKKVEDAIDTYREAAYDLLQDMNLADVRYKADFEMLIDRATRRSA